MKDNPLRKKFEKHEPVFGTFCVTGSPVVLELMGHAGLDYVIIETEHAWPGVSDLYELVMATEIGGATPITRLYENNPNLIRKALDIGCMGVYIPHVNTKEDAVRIVQAAKYPPVGKRGASPGIRAGRYIADGDWASFWKRANENQQVWALIEEEEGVRNVDEIASVKGIDVIGIGTGDLSQSMGLYGDYDNPALEEAVERVYDACKRRGVAFRPGGMNAVRDARKWMDRGARDGVSVVLTTPGDSAIYKLIKDFLATTRTA